MTHYCLSFTIIYSSCCVVTDAQISEVAKMLYQQGLTELIHSSPSEQVAYLLVERASLLERREDPDGPMGHGDSSSACQLDTEALVQTGNVDHVRQTFWAAQSSPCVHQRPPFWHSCFYLLENSKDRKDFMKERDKGEERVNFSKVPDFSCGHCSYVVCTLDNWTTSILWVPLFWEVVAPSKCFWEEVVLDLSFA